ncbi:MAG: transglycosylase SLT domain-containing protein, partial [Candidatus Dormibacteraceae bacterium]
MGKKLSPIAFTLIVVFLLMAFTAVPLAAKINTQEAQIHTVSLMAQESQATALKNQRDLEKAKALAESNLGRKNEELASARQEIERLQREVAAARAPRPAVRLPQQPTPSVKTTTTTSAPVKTKAGKSGNCESYRSLVAQYFPKSQVNNALRAMRLESGCLPSAISPSGDYGLMQVHCSAHRDKVSSCRALLN